jgi:hypothetical protein
MLFCMRRTHDGNIRGKREREKERRREGETKYTYLLSPHSTVAFLSCRNQENRRQIGSVNHENGL